MGKMTETALPLFIIHSFDTTCLWFSTGVWAGIQDFHVDARLQAPNSQTNFTGGKHYGSGPAATKQGSKAQEKGCFCNRCQLQEQEWKRVLERE